MRSLVRTAVLAATDFNAESLHYVELLRLVGDSEARCVCCAGTTEHDLVRHIHCCIHCNSCPHSTTQLLPSLCFSKHQGQYVDSQVSHSSPILHTNFIRFIPGMPPTCIADELMFAQALRGLRCQQARSGLDVVLCRQGRRRLGGPIYSVLPLHTVSRRAQRSLLRAPT